MGTQSRRAMTAAAVFRGFAVYLSRPGWSLLLSFVSALVGTPSALKSYGTERTPVPLTEPYAFPS